MTARILYALVVFIGLILLTAGANAAASGSFRYTTEAVEISERGPVTHSVIVADGFKFRFLAPPNWKVESNASEKSVTLTAPDLKAAIVIEIIPAKFELAAPPTGENFKRALLAKYPEAQITREGPAYTGAAQGFAFDFERLFGNQQKLASRFAFVPYDGGTAQIHLTSPPDDFTRYEFPIGSVWTSFQVKPLGVKGGDKTKIASN